MRWMLGMCTEKSAPERHKPGKCHNASQLISIFSNSVQLENQQLNIQRGAEVI
jgi:hypothetical protein